MVIIPHLLSNRHEDCFHFLAIMNKTANNSIFIAQSCLTLCDPIECSPPGSSVHRFFQARILEQVAISFSRGSSQPRDWTQASHIADRRFTVWAPEKPQSSMYKHNSHTSFGVDIGFQLLSIYLTNCWNTSDHSLTICGTGRLFTKWLHHSAFISAVYKSFSFPISTLIPVIFCLFFYYCHQCMKYYLMIFICISPMLSIFSHTYCPSENLTLQVDSLPAKPWGKPDLPPEKSVCRSRSNS